LDDIQVQLQHGCVVGSG